MIISRPRTRRTRSDSQPRFVMCLAGAGVALCVAVAVLCALPGHALAERGPLAVVHLHNHTDASLALVAARQNYCWFANDLDNSSEDRFAPPHGDSNYNSMKNNYFATECFEKRSRIGIDLMAKEGGGKWYLPAGSPSDFRLEWQGQRAEAHWGLQVYDSLRTWVPRQDGHGLLCWKFSKPTMSAGTDGYKDDAVGETTMDVYSDANCQSTSPTEYVPDPNQCEIFNDCVSHPSVKALAGPLMPRGLDRSAGRERAPDERVRGHAAAAADDNGKVIDLLSTLGVVCPWYVYPKDAARCTSLDVGNPAKWTLDNLTSNVRDFKITGAVGTDDPKSAVATAQVSIPSTSPAGALTASNTVMTGTSTTNTTNNGGKLSTTIGFKQTAERTVPILGKGAVEFSQTITGEWAYSKSDANTRTESTTRAVSIQAGAAPGYTTTLDVFTTRRSANYTFSADLDFGNSDAAEPVFSPADPALDQSPAYRQPCLAYVVGDSRVRNSLQYIGQQLLDAGLSPTDPSPLDPSPEVSTARRGFLKSLPYFYARGTCPGFPVGFAGAAGFKGDGVGTYQNLGYDADGKPVQVFTGCVYQTPFPAGHLSQSRLLHSRLQPPTARSSDNNSPCQDVPADGKVNVKPGMLINDRAGDGARSARGAGAIVAPATSVEILGPKTGGTIYTNNGAVDIVDAGPGNTRVIGGSGENFITGGRGNDTLIGGHGGMNYLASGPGGNDTLVQSNGHAVMTGGPGRTTFKGHNMTGVMAAGTGQNTMIATGDSSHLQIDGSKGSNTYKLQGTGTPTIVQFPSSRASIVETDHSMLIPPYVKTARATGARPITLTGDLGTLSLQANRGNDTLRAGPDPEVLRGGAGHDQIIFNPYNDDVAVGGRGPDRYFFTGTPELQTRPAALAYPAARSAARIINFDPHKGDRLVLSPSVLGREVLALRGRAFQIVAGRRPRPRNRRPVLLYSTQDHVLSFDRDGTGAISDKVIVELPARYRTVRRAWIEITRR